MDCWDIATGEETMPGLPTALLQADLPSADGLSPNPATVTAMMIAHLANLATAAATRKEIKLRQNDALSTIYNACSPPIRVYNDPLVAEQWEVQPSFLPQ